MSYTVSRSDCARAGVTVGAAGPAAAAADTAQRILCSAAPVSFRVHRFVRTIGLKDSIIHVRGVRLHRNTTRRRNGSCPA